MKIKIRKGRISMKAESARDSITLLQLLENAAGKGDDPDRMSLKKEEELNQLESLVNIEA